METLHYRGIEIKDSVKNVVFYLKFQYQITQDIRYLEAALLNIQAFLNNGFRYEEMEAVFDEVLKLLNIDKMEIYSKTIYRNRRVKATREQVRRMIIRWRPSKEQPLKIDEVVDDIVDKVKNKKVGNYYYEYMPNYTKKMKNGSADRYELVVREKECFFFDAKNMKYYTFY